MGSFLLCSLAQCAYHTIWPLGSSRQFDVHVMLSMANPFKEFDSQKCQNRPYYFLVGIRVAQNNSALYAKDAKYSPIAMSFQMNESSHG
jgi:hypothetical protein